VSEWFVVNFLMVVAVSADVLLNAIFTVDLLKLQRLNSAARFVRANR